jgi:hypothetical protein
MKRELVESSNIRSIGFKAEERNFGTLEVEFIQNNALYRIKDFPASLHKSFMEAKSKGQFYNDFLKNKFVVQKVEREEISEKAAAAALRIRDLFTATASVYSIKPDEIARIIDEEWNRRVVEKKVG